MASISTIPHVQQRLDRVGASIQKAQDAHGRLDVNALQKHAFRTNDLALQTAVEGIKDTFTREVVGTFPGMSGQDPVVVKAREPLKTLDKGQVTTVMQALMAAKARVASPAIDRNADGMLSRDEAEVARAPWLTRKESLDEKMARGAVDEALTEHEITTEG